MTLFSKNEVIYLQDEKGITLVETLAAIILLSIIFISFYAFFINSAKYTEVNREKLTAVDLGEEVVAELRARPLDQIEDIQDQFSSNEFNVSINVRPPEEVPEEVRKKLKLVLIEVTSKKQGDKPSSSFKTEIYVEVTD